MKLILTYWAVTITITSFGQSVKILKPTIGTPNNYSKQEQALWLRAIDNNSDYDKYQKLNSIDKAMVDSLEMGEGPLTQGSGCSWYCGGIMKEVTSNSYLKGAGNVNYNPENLHDFNLLTAWVPDTSGGAIGKKIGFHFEALSPRISEIMIYNGYIKNYDLFKANSRVKKFRLYINYKPYAILELADTTAQQSFSIPPTRSTIKGKDLVLTFEIMEVYKGDKYTDVAVSEINFSGLDVH